MPTASAMAKAGQLCDRHDARLSQFAPDLVKIARFGRGILRKLYRFFAGLRCYPTDGKRPARLMRRGAGKTLSKI